MQWAESVTALVLHCWSFVVGKPLALVSHRVGCRTMADATAVRDAVLHAAYPDGPVTSTCSSTQCPARARRRAGPCDADSQLDDPQRDGDGDDTRGACRGDVPHDAPGAARHPRVGLGRWAPQREVFPALKIRDRIRIRLCFIHKFHYVLSKLPFR